nr:hypothetical protein [Burkholderia dolosa]
MNPRIVLFRMTRRFDARVCDAPRSACAAQRRARSRLRERIAGRHRLRSLAAQPRSTSSADHSSLPSQYRSSAVSCAAEKCRETSGPTAAASGDRRRRAVLGPAERGLLRRTEQAGASPGFDAVDFVVGNAGPARAQCVMVHAQPTAVDLRSAQVEQRDQASVDQSARRSRRGRRHEHARAIGRALTSLPRQIDDAFHAFFSA